MKMIRFEEDTKEVTSKGMKQVGKNNMKEYLESKKKGKGKKEGEERSLAPGEISEIERNFAKYFPKEMLEAIDE